MTLSKWNTINKNMVQERLYRQKNSKTEIFLCVTYLKWNTKNDDTSFSSFCKSLLEYPWTHRSFSTICTIMLASIFFSETWIVSNLKLKRVFWLIFENYGKSKQFQKDCNNCFFQNQNYINNQTHCQNQWKLVTIKSKKNIQSTE